MARTKQTRRGLKKNKEENGGDQGGDKGMSPEWHMKNLEKAMDRVKKELEQLRTDAATSPSEELKVKIQKLEGKLARLVINFKNVQSKNGRKDNGTPKKELPEGKDDKSGIVAKEEPSTEPSVCSSETVEDKVVKEEV